MIHNSVCQFVTASSIREDIVRLLSKQQQPTPMLIDKLDACRSGVYKEISNLQQKGALTETEDGWKLTGCGQLVTDMIEKRQATEEFLGRDRTYWQHHSIDRADDASVGCACACRCPAGHRKHPRNDVVVYSTRPQNQTVVRGFY